MRFLKEHRAAFLVRTHLPCVPQLPLVLAHVVVLVVAAAATRSAQAILRHDRRVIVHVPPDPIQVRVVILLPSRAHEPLTTTFAPKAGALTMVERLLAASALVAVVAETAHRLPLQPCKRRPA